MSRRRDRRRVADRNDVIKAIGWAVTGFGLLAGLAAAYWIFQSWNVELDEAMCPVKGGAKAVHVLIFDQTDPITEQQAEQIRAIANRVIAGAKIAERFDLFTVKGDASRTLVPDLRVCNPGSGDDANEIYQNPKKIRARFDEKFAQPLKRKIDELTKASTKENSPIVETMKAAAVNAFSSYEAGERPLRVSVFSDMIQNSASSSHFRSEANFEALRRSADWTAIRPNLKGAEVQIFYLLRGQASRSGKPIQNRGHQVFWELLIEASHGRVSSLESF